MALSYRFIRENKARLILSLNKNTVNTSVNSIIKLSGNLKDSCKLTPCSRERWSEALARSASSQTHCSVAPHAGSGWSERRASRTPGYPSGRTWGCQLPGESGSGSAARAPTAWRTAGEDRRGSQNNRVLLRIFTVHDLAESNLG